jgi:hypothetical protein
MTWLDRNPLRRSLRGLAPVLALAVLAGGLMGLGGGSEGEEGAIPIPSKSYSATLTDAQGNSLVGERLTWEGKVHLRANFGNATITVPFDKLKSLKMSKGALPDRVKAQALLRSGETLDLTVESKTKFYAETQFGNYEIFTADLASVEFR